MPTATLLHGHALAVLSTLPAASVHCCITSPPYFRLRNYDVAGQLGQEDSPHDYVANLVAVFEEVKRVLRPDGTCWLVLADSYVTNPSNGRGGERLTGGTPHRSALPKTYGTLKPKNLCGIPWRTALALQDAGWWLRSE